MSDSCSCGFGVSDCNNNPESILINYILATVLHVGVYMLANWVSDWQRFDRVLSPIEREDFLSSHSQLWTERRIFLFRLLAVVVFIWTLGDMPLVYGNFPIATFTLWNWLLVGIYLLCTILLTLQHWKLVPNCFSEHRLLNLTWVIFQVEFIGATFVSIIVWTLLLPVSFTIDSEDDLLNRPGYVTHGGNFAIMLVELWIIKIGIHPIAMVWFLIWINTYGFFHAIFMVIKELAGYRPCPVYPFMSVASPYYSILLLLFLALSFVVGILAFKLAAYTTSLSEPK